MKKIILAGLLILTVFSAAEAFAQEEAVPTGITQCTMRHDISINGVDCVGAGTACTLSAAGNCGACCTIDLVYTITDWIFMIVVALATIFILVGAFNFLTAGGSPEKALAGRNYLIYAAIGVIIALLAKVIPGIAKSLMNLS